MTEFITQYNGKNKNISVEFTEPSMTEQMYKDECDVNWIINNFVRTGQMPPEKQMSYVDCTTVDDYVKAQCVLADCKSAFYDLPSKERDKFRTVENFLEFITNPANLRESYENGYIDPSTVDIADVYPEKYTVVNSQNVVTQSDAQTTISQSEKKDATSE